MQSQAQHFTSVFRTIVLAAVSALLITAAALPMPAQNSVPATARQAAIMPQFAGKLAHGASRVSHPAQPRASYKNPAAAFARTGRGWMPQGGDLYDNGPINGTTDAWTINFGFVTSDTFVVPSGGGPATGLSFGAWVFPGDLLQTVEVQITSAEFGGTVYSDQVVSFTQSGCSGNQYGFNVCTETGTLNPVNLAAGTYWVNLDNAVVNDGDPVYWDENSGAGCTSSGCPSMASENSVGTIPSEAFTVEGNAGPPQCFTSQGNLQIIHSFTEQQAGPTGPSGVTIDKTGNLYGTTFSGGDNGAGFAFKLDRFADWVLDPLFSFLGGNSGGSPFGAIVGPNGSLYGGAEGGIQNCGTGGSQYCGLVYNLTPQPTACLTALCSWTENVPYRFISDIDGTGAINVSGSDQGGNLYGTTSTGGALGDGTVFELTPSGGGWTKTTLYNFTGGDDGGTPSQVLVGNDGNLYGLASGGIFGAGVVFELMPAGGQWTESVLHAFSGQEGDGTDPGSLVQDSAGNLYGIVSLCCSPSAAIFVLEKTSSGFSFSEHIVGHSCMPANLSPGALPYEFLNNLTIDAAGELYGTGYGGFGFGSQSCFYNYVFKASNDSGGWHYQDLDFLLDTYFQAGGSLALDTSGNLYGTTNDCGTNSVGTVWQVSP
ncbi:MAG TPA: choice-of-anchor tandem repeat GloVer-containing protein [Candidatus Bathyarchaeia archaeon]|nr:choice-of-anchor tandem repeat GloVer-containing protein [Candidatus Bathyarchaeia archaeon]